MKGKRLFICLIAAVAIASAAFGCGKKETDVTEATQAVTQSETTKQTDTSKSEQQIIVMVTVDGSKGEEQAINCGGQIELPAGSTAYDALKDVCDANDYEIIGDPSYVTNINGLGEGSFGATPCGWMFYVNGEYSVTTADETVLNDGDEVIWEFVK